MANAERIYSEPGKEMARAVVVEAARATEAKTILDLWGGGASARAFRAALPDSAVLSAERDRSLWPALVVDAQLHGYGYHLGDVTDAPGTYDLIWLDFTGPVSREMQSAALQTKQPHARTLVMRRTTASGSATDWIRMGFSTVYGCRRAACTEMAPRRWNRSTRSMPSLNHSVPPLRKLPSCSRRCCRRRCWRSQRSTPARPPCRRAGHRGSPAVPLRARRCLAIR